MSSPVTFPPFQPKLKLPRRSSETTPAVPETVVAGQPPVANEPATEGSTPANVTAGPTPSPEVSESQAPFFHRPGTTAPMQNELALQTGWDQLKRARALLEAEQMDLRHRRMALDELEVKLARREATIAGREQAMREREAQAAAAQQAQQAAAAAEQSSVVTKLTRAPFDLARSVFGGGEK